MFRNNALRHTAIVGTVALLAVPTMGQVPSRAAQVQDFEGFRSGAVQGQVVDAKTQMPLAGVAVSIPTLELTAVTEADGRCRRKCYDDKEDKSPHS